MAVVLFWNPKGADDNVVHEELQILLAAHHEVAVHPQQGAGRQARLVTGLELEKKIAVHYASAGTGRLVRHVHEDRPGLRDADDPRRSTSTARSTTINGLTDAFAIEQTIDEARQES